MPASPRKTPKEAAAILLQAFNASSLTLAPGQVVGVIRELHSALDTLEEWVNEPDVRPTVPPGK